MFLAFYRFYRAVSLDGIVNFALLSCTIYLLCGPRRPRLRLWQYTLLSTAVYYLATLVPSLPSPVPTAHIYWYYFICNILVQLALARLLLQKGWLFKLIYIAFFVSFVQLYKMVCQPLYEQEFTLPTLVYARLDVLSELALCLMLVLLMLLFRRSPLDTSLRFSARQLFVSLYFPVSLLISYILISNDIVPLRYSMQLISAAAITNLPVIYYFLSLVIRSYEELRRMDRALLQTQARLENLRVSAQLQEKLKKERHELKNNYYYIQALLEQNKYDQLREYLDRMTGQTLESLNQIDTGNALMDCLLNRKLAQARKLRIATSTEIAVPAELSVDEESLCTILLNLLDNALEASQKERDPLVQISIKCTPGYLVCSIRNRVSQDVLARNPNLQTTKADADDHGFGTRIVRAAAGRCDGTLQYQMENGFFTVNFMLPLLTGPAE